VTALLRATQATRNATVVTAPRVTLFNGQRAYVLVATQLAYVSDISSNTGGGDLAVGFDPTIDIVSSGVVLDVAATVSADRKYVTLTLRPQLSTLVDLRSFTFQGQTDAPTDGAGGGGGFPGTGDDDDDNVDTINNSFLPNLAVQQPEVQITEVRTTVSVPDGGTLLLGGQTLAGEVEIEAGTPVLSKIPFLKRLFTNRSMAKDEQVLLILVKPTIIIQREIEQQQFPLLSSRANQ
jgi:general secretion pathway protein D